MFSKTSLVWSQQADLGRCTETTDLHRKHFLQMFFFVLHGVLSLSFVAARRQKVHDSQHDNLQSLTFALQHPLGLNSNCLFTRELCLGWS